MNRQPAHLTQGNVFLALVAMLLAIGTIMVYSASMSSRWADAEQIYLERHLLALLIACSLGWIASRLPPQFWYRATPVLYLACLGLLVAVLIPGIGTRVNGAQRWLRLAGFSLQPSEFAKLILPLLICRALHFPDGSSRLTQSDAVGQSDEVGLNTRHWLSGCERRIVPLLGLVALPLVLTLLEPDLGTALFLGLGAALTFFLAGWPLRHFLLIGGASVPLLLGLIALKPYQLARIQGFVLAWRAPEEAPYQVRQSLTTLGVGGLSGTGIGQGWQKLSFLPEANTDFIFSVIGEELGLLGTWGVIAIWSGLFWTGSRWISSSRCDSFSIITAQTLLAQLVLQAALNVGVVTAMVPPKGISHPFISYGGSSLLSSLLAIGIIVSLMRQPQFSSDEESRQLETDLNPLPAQGDHSSEQRFHSEAAELHIVEAATVNEGSAVQ